MSITVECPACGKKLKAPNSAAGRRARCPQCSTAIDVPTYYEAEVVAPAGPRDAEMDRFSADEDEFLPKLPAAPRVGKRRKTCPACGEKNAAGATTCRSCGEPIEGAPARRGSVDRETIRLFRRRTHALGGFVTFLGSLVLLGAILLGSVVFMLVAALYLAIGICICLKQMWAIYAAMVLFYISLVVNLLTLPLRKGPELAGNVIGLLIVVAILVEIHRSVRAASEMKRAGIPLTAKP